MLVGIGIRESDCQLIYGLNQALKKEALFCIIEENEFCHATFILVVAFTFPGTLVLCSKAWSLSHSLALHQLPQYLQWCEWSIIALNE